MAKRKLVVAAVSVFAALSAFSDVEVGNDRFTLKLDDTGRAKSLVVKVTGEECLDAATAVPFFSITQERPYNNENKLTHPNCRTTYPATRVVREGNVLVVDFRFVRYSAEIADAEGRKESQGLCLRAAGQTHCGLLGHVWHLDRASRRSVEQDDFRRKPNVRRDDVGKVRCGPRLWRGEVHVGAITGSVLSLDA